MIGRRGAHWARRSTVALSMAGLPLLLAVGLLYRHGGWSFGPSSPAARDACQDHGGEEMDLFLLHHCTQASGLRVPSLAP